MGVIGPSGEATAVTWLNGHAVPINHLLNDYADASSSDAVSFIREVSFRSGQ